MGAGFSEPSPRWGLFSTTVGGKHFVWGGHTKDFKKQRGELGASIHSFDPFLESWTETKCSGSTPPGLYDGACASAGHCLYVYGGIDVSHYQSSLYQLDVNSWTWKQLPNGPSMKSGCGMVTYGNKLVLLGGYGIPSGPTQPGAEFTKHSKYTDGRGWTNECHTIDLEEGTWSSPPVSGTRPPPCTNFSLTMVDDHHAVLFGGRQPPGQVVNDVYMLDLARMHWTKLDHHEGEPYPVGRLGHAAVCLGYGGDHPHLLVTGGRGVGDKVLSEAWMLDVKSGRWKEVKLPNLKPRYLHSAAAFSHSQGLVEVTIFGGCPQWPSNYKSDDDFPQITNTTVLRFEYQQPSSTDGPRWVPTDTATRTQLGKKERVEAKRRKIQATRTAAATGDGGREQSDREVMKEEPEEDRTDSDDFIEEIQELISHDVPVNRKHAHSMFVGPNGSGKSSLMARLLGRPRKEFSPSTGVCNPVVMVDIDIDNPSTFHSASIINSDTWEEVEYDISLLRQMNVITPPSEQVQLKSFGETTSQNAEMTSPTPPSTPSTASFVNESTQLPERHQVCTNQMEEVQAKPNIFSASTPSLSDGAIREVVMAVIDKCGSIEGVRKFLNGASLYLRDTGGQVEFQELVSLLIFGPSIFLFVFRLDYEFQSKFSIEYRIGKNESTNCYTSSITTEEALLQCLASVYAMDTPGKAGVKTHQPLVFIIGTHRDKLGPSAGEKIAKMNEHLDTLLQKSGFQDLVQYADGGKGQVLFAVDNTSEGDEDFKPIRSKVHSLISGREEFTIKYPITYLLFCLHLRNLKRSILTLDECKDIAAQCGIVGDQQVSHLLNFLHLRIGVIQYYDVDGLRHIVVKEPQVLFNKVTNLIIRTFSCEALTTKEQRDFQKGILSASVLQSVLGRGDEISCQDFLNLLVHLRIITPYPSTTPGAKEERYFIPCVLNHVQESSEEDPHTDILPLSIRFRCSHCPKGLFGVLITRLMTPESADSSHTSFTLIEDKIFKDQVSFLVHSNAIQDELYLKIFPSHLDIKFFPYVDEDRDLSIGEVCSNVRQVIKTSILRSLEDLHYNHDNVEPVMCFRCEHCSELHQVKKGKDHHLMSCKEARKNMRIPMQGRCWFNEVSDSTTSSPTTSHTRPVETDRGHLSSSVLYQPSTFAILEAASIHKPSSQRLDHGLIFNLKNVLASLRDVPAKKYMKLAINLGLEPQDVERFEQDHPRNSERVLIDIANLWLRSVTDPTPSWQLLEEAVQEL